VLKVDKKKEAELAKACVDVICGMHTTTYDRQMVDDAAREGFLCLAVDLALESEGVQDFRAVHEEVVGLIRGAITGAFTKLYMP
jgi:hypothetical protein